MAEIDLRFLGERIERIQTELRNVRTEQLRLEADQATIRAEMANRFDIVDGCLEALETHLGELQFGVANFEKSVDVQFEIVHRTTATNLEIVLAAIRDKSP